MSALKRRDVAGELSQQHAIHGMFGRVFDRLGGEEFLFDWAQENPGRFITLMTQMAPRVAPTSAIQGDVTIQVNAALKPTELDVVSDQ